MSRLRSSFFLMLGSMTWDGLCSHVAQIVLAVSFAFLGHAEVATYDGWTLAFLLFVTIVTWFILAVVTFFWGET